MEFRGFLKILYVYFTPIFLKRFSINIQCAFKWNTLDKNLITKYESHLGNVLRRQLSYRLHESPILDLYKSWPTRRLYYRTLCSLDRFQYGSFGSVKKYRTGDPANNSKTIKKLGLRFLKQNAHIKKKKKRPDRKSLYFLCPAPSLRIAFTL